MNLGAGIAVAGIWINVGITAFCIGASDQAGVIFGVALTAMLATGIVAMRE